MASTQAHKTSHIVALTSGGPLAWSVGLIARLGPVTVIEERPEATGEIIKRRLRLVGAGCQVRAGCLRSVAADGCETRLKASSVDPDAARARSQSAGGHDRARGGFTQFG